MTGCRLQIIHSRGCGKRVTKSLMPGYGFALGDGDYVMFLKMHGKPSDAWLQ